MGKRITVTPNIARAAATDAGNASMRKGKRAAWAAEDFSAAVAEFDRLWPTASDPCVHCEAPELHGRGADGPLSRSAPGGDDAGR